MADTAIVDVDGTLVDSNYHHALAWSRAFRRYDITVPMWRLHRAIGMGGDRLVAHVTDDVVEERYGEGVREGWVEEFDRLIDDVQPLEGAHELLEAVTSRGFRLVLASSGKAKHVDHFLDLLGGRSIADAWTTSEDVERSKPEPDLLRAALAKVAGADGVVVGDSVWDCVAAGRLGLPTLAVMTGGFSVEELREAGASRVFESLVDLRKALDETPLRTPRG